jgi:hypothetical protein
MRGERVLTEADPTGTRYAFAKGADKAGGGDGWGNRGRTTAVSD